MWDELHWGCLCFFPQTSPRIEKYMFSLFDPLLTTWDDWITMKFNISLLVQPFFVWKFSPKIKEGRSAKIFINLDLFVILYFFLPWYITFLHHHLRE